MVNEPMTDAGSADETGTEVPATQPEGSPAPATNDSSGEKPDNSKSSEPDNIKELVRQRDTANQKAKDLEERFGNLEDSFYKEKFIDQMAKEHPEVPREILEEAVSPEHADSLAKTWGKHSDQLRNSIHEELTTVKERPAIPKKDARKQLDALKDTGRLEDAIEIQTNMEK